jgi:hypothetical protein
VILKVVLMPEYVAAVGVAALPLNPVMGVPFVAASVLGELKLLLAPFQSALEAALIKIFKTVICSIYFDMTFFHSLGSHGPRFCGRPDRLGARTPPKAEGPDDSRNRRRAF